MLDDKVGKSNGHKSLKELTKELTEKNYEYVLKIHTNDKSNKGIMQCRDELKNFVYRNDLFKIEDFSQKDLDRIRKVFPEDSFIIVRHQTKDKWRDKFKKDGIDATIIPPDMQLGRLTKYGQAKIFESGLYVEPVHSLNGGVLIAVKPSELAISYESSFSGCHTPECALYAKRDAIIKAKIPADRVLGSLDWQAKPKDQWKKDVHYSWNHEWKFNPNKISLENKEMKKIINCFDFPPPNWCKCNE